MIKKRNRTDKRRANIRKKTKPTSNPKENGKISNWTNISLMHSMTIISKLPPEFNPRHFKSLSTLTGKSSIFL